MRCESEAGFRVVYGPVRAGDIPAFLQAGMKATPEMRRVEFPLRDRLAVVPVELVMGAKYVLLTMAVLLALSGLGPDGYAASRILARGLPSAALLLGAFVAGTVFGPLLLPWLPGRALSAKGTWIGLAMVAGLGAYMLTRSPAMPDWFAWSAWAILLPVTTSFILMNFTGATTYTSLSGVRRKCALPCPFRRSPPSPAFCSGSWRDSFDGNTSHTGTSTQESHMTPLRYLSNVVTLRLDETKCTGCGMCEMVCPHAVFRIDEHRARIADRDACMECGACARNCPAEAISVDAGVGLRRGHHQGCFDGHRSPTVPAGANRRVVGDVARGGTQCRI